MDSKRQAEVFRAFVKKALREKGLRFDKNLTQRDIGREVKCYNDENALSEPLTVAEFCELYLDIMKELVTEHFALIEKEIAKAKEVGAVHASISKIRQVEKTKLSEHQGGFAEGPRPPFSVPPEKVKSVVVPPVGCAGVGPS